MMLLEVSLIKLFKDDVLIIVKIGNFVKKYFNKNYSIMTLIRVSLLILFKDDAFLSVVETIN